MHAHAITFIRIYSLSNELLVLVSCMSFQIYSMHLNSIPLPPSLQQHELTTFTILYLPSPSPSWSILTIYLGDCSILLWKHYSILRMYHNLFYQSLIYKAIHTVSLLHAISQIIFVFIAFLHKFKYDCRIPFCSEISGSHSMCILKFKSVYHCW